MSSAHLERGAAAERLAAQYLQQCGLKILARNLRCRWGEIDLLCLDAEVLAVVEVRQRQRSDFGGALNSVTWAKRRKIIRATQFILCREAHWQYFALRFDVFAIEGRPDGAHRIEWVKDAFRA
ncbi:MAG TPA: YraN family protein [Steroidobacteraceae bacterium]|jgi:putative endonuclease|nr:YraN family protein [Steroidobacteraceae bacterium]